MMLSGLLSLCEQVADYRQLLHDLLRPEGVKIEVAIPEAARSFFIAALCEKMRVPVMVVTPQMERAKRVFEELNFWCRESTGVHIFPEPELIHGKNHIVGSDIMMERMKALSLLAFRNGTNNNNNNYNDISIPIIVSTASAVASKTASRSDFIESYFIL